MPFVIGTFGGSAEAGRPADRSIDHEA